MILCKLTKRSGGVFSQKKKHAPEPAGPGWGERRRCTPYKSRKQTHNLSLPGSVGAGVFFGGGSFEGEKKYVKIMMNLFLFFGFFRFSFES